MTCDLNVSFTLQESVTVILYSINSKFLFNPMFLFTLFFSFHVYDAVTSSDLSVSFTI